MLLDLLFWTILGFIFHFYIIFGTNLLTGGPAQICCFMLISVFRRKGISNRIQTERNLHEDLSWNKRNPGDLERKLETQRGGHEAGGAPSTLVDSPGLPWHALQAHQVGFLQKLTSPVDFVPF